MATKETETATSPQTEVSSLEPLQQKPTAVREGLQQSIQQLAKVGGFSFLESVLPGIQNLNPERKARKKIFLSEETKKEERRNLSAQLAIWAFLLKESSSITEMQEKSREQIAIADKNLKKNLKKALEATKNLEQSYRSAALFYKNTEQDKLKNVSMMNASMEQLTDLDNPRFIEYVGTELKQNFDRLDLRNNYSLLVVPGYLGSNSVLERWGKIAHNNKVLLYTDFQHFDHPDDVVDIFSSANLTGADIFRSNIAMTCNWLLGRNKVAEVGEEEHLFVPPSAALAGKIYSTLMSQITAGRKHGTINDAAAVAFDLKKSELSHMERMGLIPMVNEYGKVMAFSGKTLFNGDNLGLQTYSVVRVFDYVTKVLFDFLNRRAFENWNTETEADLRSQIMNFLGNVTGPGRLIEAFSIKRFERDPNQKDRIYLDIHMTPFFPSKSFIIKLDGYKGEDGNTSWGSDYAQE